MSGTCLEIEPHNWPRNNDLGGGRYLPIPPQGPFDAVTINSVSTKSGAVQPLCVRMSETVSPLEITVEGETG